MSRAGHVLAFKTHVEDLDALRTVDKGSTSTQDIPETKSDEPILSFPTHRQSLIKLDCTTASRDIRTSENSKRAYDGAPKGGWEGGEVPARGVAGAGGAEFGKVLEIEGCVGDDEGERA